MTFKDHFSARAALYAAYRPHYPAQLFTYLSGLVRSHALAVDCGTGSGQAALGLAEHFDRVVAVDPSAGQLANATPHDRIEYRLARAESTGLPSGSADLVVAAQCLHWLETDAFFRESKRLLAPHGVIAVWGYGDPVLPTESLDRTLRLFNRGLLEPYWFAERALLLDGYRTIEFPFVELSAPEFELRMHWSLAELVGYLRTWSAVANFVAERGTDPVIEVERDLARDWGDPAVQRLIRWPLHLRAGTTDRRPRAPVESPRPAGDTAT
ncbi:MAG TPA: class I SAM-dependent methyltransferase [Gemmatimonadaceae bacterium]|nr:class I SAM-dependent methyltransferase [Gemmatimonadaceae bacterium]